MHEKIESLEQLRIAFAAIVLDYYNHKQPEEAKKIKFNLEFFKEKGLDERLCQCRKEIERINSSKTQHIALCIAVFRSVNLLLSSPEEVSELLILKEEITTVIQALFALNHDGHQHKLRFNLEEYRLSTTLQGGGWLSSLTELGTSIRTYLLYPIEASRYFNALKKIPEIIAEKVNAFFEAYELESKSKDRLAKAISLSDKITAAAKEVGCVKAKALVVSENPVGSGHCFFDDKIQKSVLDSIDLKEGTAEDEVPSANAL